jgi:hypothetical protein
MAKVIISTTQTASDPKADIKIATPAPTLLLHIATTARIIAIEKNAMPITVQQVRKPKPMQIHPALTAELLGFADVGRGGGEE